MEIMNLCVLHLSDVERTSGKGVEREELITWYLEQKEDQVADMEELEYEHDLIAKVLTKLAKVSWRPCSRLTITGQLPARDSWRPAGGPHAIGRGERRVARFGQDLLHGAPTSRPVRPLVVCARTFSVDTVIVVELRTDQTC